MRACAVAACGRMGEAVRRAIAEEAGIELAAAFEAPGHSRLGEEVAPGVVLGDDPNARHTSDIDRLRLELDASGVRGASGCKNLLEGARILRLE